MTPSVVGACRRSAPRGHRAIARGSRHAANSLAALADTAALAALADTTRIYGLPSGYARDPRLHHHVRGMLFVASGRDEDAVRELRQALYSKAFGYSRASFEMARALMRMGRMRDAIPVLQAALRGPFDGEGLYVTRTDLHEQLAKAWDAVGQRDSAVVHYDVVARAWATADPAVRARADTARMRSGALGGALAVQNRAMTGIK